MRASLAVRQRVFGSTKNRGTSSTAAEPSTARGSSSEVEEPKTVTAEAAAEESSTTITQPTTMADPKATKNDAVAEGDNDEDDDDDLFGDADEDVDIVPPMPVEEKNSGAGTTITTPTITTIAPKASTEERTAPAPAAPVAAPAPAPAPSKPVSEVTTSIPRKQSSSSNTATDNNNHPGAKYGLPVGVKIPASVQEKNLLHGKILEALKKIPVELMNESLTEYDDAVQIKGASIRNHGAYLFGVIKRYVDVQVARGDAMLQASLAPSVQKKLDQLVQSGYCTKEEMDEKVKGKIRMLSEKDALVALDELASVDRSQIRNFGSYLMGIIVKRHRGGDQRSGTDSQSQSQPNSRPSRRDSDDRHYREGKGDSFRRERSRDRDRSRDRFDDRRSNDNYRRDRDRDRDLSHYRPQNNNVFPGQQPQMGGTMPGPPLQQQQQMPPMNPYQQQPQQQQPYMQQPNPNQGYPNSNQQQQQQFVPQMGAIPPMNQNQNFQQPNQGYQPQNQNFQPQGRPGGPLPSNMVAQPPQQNMMQQQMGQGQAPLQQPYNPQQQQQPYMMNQANPMMNPQQQQQPPYMQQQQMGGGHLPPPPPQRGSYGNAQPQPVVGGWQQQPHQQLGPGSYGTHGQGNAGWQPPQQGQVPLDIFGLADKAASAVQQLVGQNKGLGPTGGLTSAYSAPPPSQYSSGPNPISIPMQQGLPGSQMPYSNAPNSSMPYNNAMNSAPQNPDNRFNSSEQAGSNKGGRKGRATTTATLNELPVMVQYAVQNLQATGQVDHALDGGILGMIKDLPEPLALAALQKFSSCDKNAMRNKTAYLAGVLRRELERIHRR